MKSQKGMKSQIAVSRTAELSRSLFQEAKKEDDHSHDNNHPPVKLGCSRPKVTHFR